MLKFTWLRDRLAWLAPSSTAVLVLVVLLSLIVNAAGWAIPISREIEQSLFDIRQSAFVPNVKLDERIAMVVYDEQTASQTGKRQPLDRKTIAYALENIDKMGAKAIGIDLLFLTETNDDAILVQTLNQMKTRTVIMSSGAPLDDDFFVESLDLLQPITTAIENDNVEKASSALAMDRDRVVRNWPSRNDTLPRFVDQLASDHSPAVNNPGPIRFSKAQAEDFPVFESYSIEIFANPEFASLLGKSLKGRYIIIGSDLIDIDRFETSISGLDPLQPTMTGTEIQAHMLSQKLDDFTYGRLPSSIPLLTSVLILVGTYFLASSNIARLPKLVSFAAILTALLVTPFLVHHFVGGSFDFPAFGWIVAWLSGLSIAWIIYRETQWQKGIAARLALTRYLPPDVAKTILKRPDGLNLASEKRPVYTLFTDLEGFTSLCHRSDPDEVAEFLNHYLELLSGIILSHGGTVDKFVGDAVVGIWGAPLAKADDGERALEAATALFKAGEAIRLDPNWKDLDLGRTRVGLHFGEAIVGNFGGEGRIQYTALGDTMNVAARLEAANKELLTKILISDDVARSVDSSDFRPMGSVQLRGRETPVTVFEPNVGNSMKAEELVQLGKIMDRLQAGDYSASQELQEIADSYPDDLALGRLAARFQSTNQ